MVQRLPPLNQTRTKRRQSGPTEGPPDDNQRTRNIPNRESTPWVFRAGCTVAQATRHRARVQKDKCSRFRGFLQRIFDTFSQRLSVQASFPRIHRSRRRTLQAHMQSRILHFDHSGLCEPAADAFVSCQPRRAGSSCHSSRYSARYRSRGIGPEPLPVGTITRGPFAGCRSLRRGTPS